MFRKLRRVYSQGYLNYIPRFSETFPELKKLDNEELCRRFQQLNIDFYSEEKVPVRVWMRLTFPFAILLMIAMLLGLPICFLLTGSWNYPLGEKNVILNWFRELKIF